MAPRLPDDSVLGGLPDGNSRRPVASFDTTAPGRAMEQMGQGIANLGKGIGAGIDAFAERRRQQDGVEETVKAGEREVESQKWSQRVREAQNEDEIKALAEERRALDPKYLPFIKDPERRKVQTAKWAVDTERDVNVALERGNRLRDEKLVTTANNTAEEMRRMALEQNTPEARTKAIDTVNAQIDGLVANRAMTPEKAVEAKRKWVENFAWDEQKMRPAAEAIYALGGLRAGLKAWESTNDATAVNGKGYAGFYQFGAPRLQTMGVYTPGSGEDMTGWSGSLRNAPGKWSGTFNIPGFPQVKTLNDFLASPAAQEKAYEIHDELMDKEIKSQGLDAYIGQTIGGVTHTADTIKAMMHLGGAKSAKNYLVSGGTDDASDGKTRVSQYAARAAGGKYPLAGAISPERRQDLIKQKTIELKQEQAASANKVTAERQAAYGALELKLHDGTADRSDIIRTREELRLDFDEVKKLETILDNRIKKDGDVALFHEIMGGGRKVNQYAKDDKDALEAGVESLSKASGGTMTKPQAAGVIFEKTGVMPQTGTVAIRGDLNSTDAGVVGTTFQVVSNVLRRNPRAFVGTEGQADIEKAFTFFQHGTETLGQTPDVIARRFIESQNPGTKVKVTDQSVKEFGETLDKDALNDLGNAVFAGSHWFYDNNAGPPTNRSPMVNDYKEMAVDHFKQYGDTALAKKHALLQLNKMYGVSNGNLTKFPAEMAYPPINNSHEYIYDQALEVINAYAPNNAKGLKRENIQLRPLDGMRTSAAFLSGRRTPYQILFTTKVDGMPITHAVYLPNGAEFQPDPETGREMMTAKRKAEFDAARSPAEAIAPATVPQVVPSDVGERSWKPGRPVRTPEERQAIADETNTANQTRANELGELAKRRAQLLKDAEDKPNLAKKLRDATPRNPFEKFPYKPGRGRE